MKKPTLSLLTIAVIFAPLTALAQKIQRQNQPPTQTNSRPSNRVEPQINHNAYGTPLIPAQVSGSSDRANTPKVSNSTTRSKDKVNK